MRRSPEAYAPLVAGRGGPLPPALEQSIVSFGAERSRRSADRPARRAGATGHWAPTPRALVAQALVARSASPERIAADTAIDAGGLVPDLQAVNSWIQVVDEVEPMEMLEVQLCNMTAPFILVSRLRSLARGLAARGAATSSTSRRWRASSAAATRGPAIRTRTWPRRR